MTITDVRFFTLTKNTLKQIRGHHGCIRYKCVACGKEITEINLGQTIVSFVLSESVLRMSRRMGFNASKKKGNRDYVHAKCYEVLRNGL